MAGGTLGSVGCYGGVWGGAAKLGSFTHYCGLLAEVEAGLNDLCVVEHHERARWQIVGQVAEPVVADLSLAVDQQLRLVALLQWELCDALVGQLVVVVTDSDMTCIHLFHLV